MTSFDDITLLLETIKGIAPHFIGNEILFFFIITSIPTIIFGVIKKNISMTITMILSSQILGLIVMMTSVIVYLSSIKSIHQDFNIIEFFFLIIISWVIGFGSGNFIGYKINIKKRVSLNR